MTRIDFYLLPTEAATALTAAARLCDKAVQAGKSVFVACADVQQRALLDDLLWSQRQGSFIAHERWDGGKPPAPPLPQLLLGLAEPPEGWQDVLVNLGAEVPDYFSRFERLCELVASDEASRKACRGRYKFYRDRGYELKTLEQAADGSWAARA